MKFKNRVKKAISVHSRDESLLTRGVVGKATILAVKSGWMKTETNSGTNTVYKYRLRVTLDGQAPYEVDHSEDEKWAEQGQEITVRVDPDDPENLLIDWGAMTAARKEAVQQNVAAVEAIYNPATISSDAMEPIEGISLERYAQLSAGRVKHNIATDEQLAEWLKSEGVTAAAYEAATTGWTQRMTQQPAVAIRYSTLFQQAQASA
jgi:hypothetical protein